MKALITGGAGFIGSNIAEALVKRGYEVHIVDNLTTGKITNVSFLSEEHIYIEDIRNSLFLKDLLQNNEYDYIIHLAAMVSVVETIDKPIESNQINIDATLNLLESIKNYNPKLKKFIFASSAALYGDLPGLPKSVDDVLKPLSPYAIQKFSGESYAKIYHDLYGIPSTAFRFFNVYGPKQNPESDYSGVISILNKKFESKSTFTYLGDGKQTRDFVYIDDLVSAVMLVLDNEQTNGKVYNLGTGIETSLLEVYNAFKESFSYEIPVEFKPARKGDIKYSVAEVSPLQALGYSARYNITEGIKAYTKFNRLHNE
ncbi:NAD-dependent epimerase/dehydratase family protein [Macrococcoides canis]|uniref:NAD-dependent epimerase/dehydratase family protein n=1 Tax=Macrococcoides canis TaxID=1855823 RepID=A0AAE6X1R4_9STAP|nr:NAD-dependent epimerase/dehydratase family protein [Macrococcus canis]QIH77962.1 NAD-dependent epimerase/dehydratase family protein [Macrococcus canis]